MLDSARILDLTWVLGGPFGGQVLAQLGADVIKVEPPEGDSSRRIPPYFVEDDSSFYLSVNRGKRSIGLDLKRADGLQTFYDLVRKSDAVIYGFAPDVPKRLGIDFATLSEINPAICVGQLIGLHDEGEFSRAPAYDLIVQAMGGIMSITGDTGGPPVRVGYQIADLAGGLYLALAVAGSLYGAAKSGRGELVQVSLLDCQLALLTWHAQNLFVGGARSQRLGSRSPIIAPSELFLCADDRYLAVSPTGTRFWVEFCKALGRPDLATDARFCDRQARLDHVDELAALLRPIFARRSAESWAAMLFDQRIPAARVLDVQESLEQPVSMLRSMVETVQHPRTGAEVKFLGTPFKTRSSPNLNFPPSYAADTRDILTEVCDYSRDRIDQLLMDQSIFEGGACNDMAKRD